MRKKIAVVFGTRPEAIKCAPVIQELRKRSELFEVIIIATAQHREILDQVLKVFGIEVDVDLNLMRENQPLEELTSRLIDSLSKIFKEHVFDYIFVQGDTTTTFITSLAAFYNKIPVCHIEAGLRTFNKYSPFPEEMNRQLTTILADLHFSPTFTATNNLLLMGIEREKIFLTGNTVIDALYYISCKFNFNNKRDEQRDEKFVLITAHRRESFGEPIKNICRGIKTLVAKHKEIYAFFPVHPNPNIKDIVYKELGGIDRVNLLPPLSYLEFVKLMHKVDIILTDSGGVQEEAPFFHKPVIVLRDTSERMEGVKAGCLKIAGTHSERIVEETMRLLTDDKYYKDMSNVKNPFGDGKASERIVSALSWSCGFGEKPKEFEAKY